MDENNTDKITAPDTNRVFIFPTNFHMHENHEYRRTAVPPIALPNPYPLQCASAETPQSCLTSKSKDILVDHDGQTLIKNPGDPDRKGSK